MQIMPAQQRHGLLCARQVMIQPEKFVVGKGAQRCIDAQGNAGIEIIKALGCLRNWEGVWAVIGDGIELYLAHWRASSKNGN